MSPQSPTEQPSTPLEPTQQHNDEQISSQDAIPRQQQQPDVASLINVTQFSSAAAPLQPPSHPVECSTSAAESDLLLSPDNTALSSSLTTKPSKQVSFPTDDAIAVVHHLRPSSSAGDLSTRHDDGATVAAPHRASPGCWPRFKAAVRQLKQDILALYYAVHDPRTPILSKILPWLVLAYALSPLDLIPDFIPVLGYLDDLLLLPLGLWLSYKLIPQEVMEDCRVRAALEPMRLGKNWVVATLVFSIWCSGLLLLAHWLISTYGRRQLQQHEGAVLGGLGGVALLVFVLWAEQRLRHERQSQVTASDALLAGYDSSDSESV